MESAAVPHARAVPGTVEEARVKRLVLRYVIASTLFFAVSGLLGVVLRESQADIWRLKDNFFYAAMTAHGLGAFVAWAAFGIMGIAFWVLREVRFPMRPFGFAMAETAWWTMVIGVLGIVVTTLFMGFGASWVFLYPLPFHASGDWSDGATGIFSASVLVVGVSIIVWSIAIVHTCIGPGLQVKEGASVLNRFGCALGFGYLFPRRFATERSLPYPVIPLIVIGIDMIIATLPLAVLLVFMVIQSIDSSVTVDPLLAKNMLWFFGHPVVYLLLFPAVALYYLLIPRYAKRELVAGRVVAIAWTVAVIANVGVWAHHIYVDYPEGTIQSSLNLAMQPMTYALVLPSAMSLYSLSLTVWRSDFEWSPAAKFLAAAMTGWLVAGLSGVVNATIAFDKIVHNTMWIVGHFHNMALLNIGLVVFAGVYAFLPALIGKEWYSRTLGNVHLWLTVIGGYGMITPMLIQGLNGAPRRYAVLPGRFDTLTQLTIPFVVMMLVGQLVFAWNLVRTLQGAKVRRAETATRSIALTTTLLLVAAAIGGGALALGSDNRGGGGGGGGGAQQGVAGQQTFIQTCGSCHTLKAAGTTGTVGPNLDKLKPSKTIVLNAIATGPGPMPDGLLKGQQAQDVADFVSQNAGK